MRLIKGKFYDSNGSTIALEFGNKEQIKLMELAQNLKDGAVLGFGLDGDKMVWGFMCPCNHNVIVPDGENNLPKEIKCDECGTIYSIKERDDEFEAIVKTKQGH